MSETQVRNSGEQDKNLEQRSRAVPVPARAQESAAEGEGLLARLSRALFGKAGSLRADLEVVLEAGASGETGFSPEERTLLRNILGLREQRVEDVMVPRTDIIAVHQDITLGELVRVFENAGHSRLVVYNDTLDDPIGMVHIRDVVAFMSARVQFNAQRRGSLRGSLDLKAVDLAVPLSSTKITRSILFVPPSMPAIDLLAKMQATRIHLALVIDEYGGTDGLVSIEDIVEQIVGEIEDEHDIDEAPTVLAQRDGSYIADARASLEEVTKLIGAEFDVGEAADDVDTLGGFLVTRIGRIPVRGELVAGPGPFEIEVLDADPRRVKKVRIHRDRRRPPALRDTSHGEAETDTAAPALQSAATTSVAAQEPLPTETDATGSKPPPGAARQL
jgi:CBS domain containing-hemolysin-like protein